MFTSSARRAATPCSTLASRTVHVVAVRTGIRLTSRGRLGLVVVLAMLLVAGFSLGRASRSAGSAPAPAYQHTVVHPGQTLWTIARQVAPDRDPRETVADLEQLNDLTGATLEVGQSLRLPATG